MRIGIIYDSQYGNTQQLAETIANELEATDSVLITSVSSGTSELRDRVDLLIVGGPPPRCIA